MSSEARGPTLVSKIDVVGVAIGEISLIRVMTTFEVAAVVTAVVTVVVTVVVVIVIAIEVMSDTSDVVGTCYLFR